LDDRYLARVEFIDEFLSFSEALRRKEGPIPSKIVLEIEASEYRTHL